MFNDTGCSDFTLCTTPWAGLVGPTDKTGLVHRSATQRAGLKSKKTKLNKYELTLAELHL